MISEINQIELKMNKFPICCDNGQIKQNMKIFIDIFVLGY